MNDYRRPIPTCQTRGWSPTLDQPTHCLHLLLQFQRRLQLLYLSPSPLHSQESRDFLPQTAHCQTKGSVEGRSVTEVAIPPLRCFRGTWRPLRPRNSAEGKSNTKLLSAERDGNGKGRETPHPAGAPRAPCPHGDEATGKGYR